MSDPQRIRSLVEHAANATSSIKFTAPASETFK